MARQRKTKTDDGEKTKGGERERETEYRSTLWLSLSLSPPLYFPSRERTGRRLSRSTGRLTGSVRKQCRLYLIKESGCHGNCEVNERSIDSAHLNSGQPLTEHFSVPSPRVEYPTHTVKLVYDETLVTDTYVSMNINKD